MLGLGVVAGACIQCSPEVIGEEVKALSNLLSVPLAEASLNVYRLHSLLFGLPRQRTTYSSRVCLCKEGVWDSVALYVLQYTELYCYNRCTFARVGPRLGVATPVCRLCYAMLCGVSYCSYTTMCTMLVSAEATRYTRNQ